jgi:hypothetical protein
MAYNIKKTKVRSGLRKEFDKYDTHEEKMAFLAGAEYENKLWAKSLRKK